MIVPITVTPPSAFSPKLAAPVAKLGHDELFLIELQGTLDVQCPESTTRDGQLIGTLNTTDMAKPTLVIGHHLLEGEVVSLPKPLGVLQRRVRSPVSADDADPEGDDGGDSEGREEQENEKKGKRKEDREIRWDVAAVVKKKMVFSKRPMPIAKAKPASTAGSRRT